LREHFGSQIYRTAALDADGFRAKQCLFEGVNSTDIRAGCSGAHADAQRDSTEIDVGTEGDYVFRQQFGEPFSGHDHHIGGHTSAKLRPDRLGSVPLRRSRRRGDRNACGVLELGQKFVIRGGEPTGHQDPDLGKRCGGESKSQCNRNDQLAGGPHPSSDRKRHAAIVTYPGAARENEHCQQKIVRYPYQG
jgi:hypothetical protein